MTTALSRYYFHQLKNRTGGGFSGDPDILDLLYGPTITIDELELYYKDYIELCEDITYYVDQHDLDTIEDRQKIMDHFSDIDKDLFEYSEAYLLDFVNYMLIKIEKKLLD